MSVLLIFGMVVKYQEERTSGGGGSASKSQKTEEMHCGR